MIAIIGGGNVASHLYKALNTKVNVTIVDPHSLKGIPANPDIILIAVADKAIAEVANKIDNKKAIVAHTSGSIPMEVLNKNHPNIGVLYPLQTFTKTRIIDYREIPLFIEGNTPEVVNKLRKIGSLFADKIYEADSEKRKNLHLAAVFACNFTNALASISEKLIENTGFNFNVLQPLMKETVNKLEVMSPYDAQTGPASRWDKQVMETHLNMLEDKPELKTLYSIFSDYIKKIHET